MAHELATINGRTAMAYQGETPWHRLGTKLPDLMTAAEAMAAASLDYPVESLPVFARDHDGREIPIPDRVLNVRRDGLLDAASVPLGLVSDRYRIVQNSEAFGFLDAIVAEGGMRYETAGALGKGERVWMLGKLPGHIRVKRTDDVIDEYLLLHNTHDGTSALRVLFSPVRVVCANTERMALNRAGAADGVKILHTGDLAAKVDEARKALGLASHYFGVFGEGANALAGVTPSRAMLTEYFGAIIPDPAPLADGKLPDPGKSKAARMTLFGLFEQGMGQDMPGIRGTAWAAYNAVTEYVDHHLGRNEAKRLESAWWGDGARMKARAWDGAIAMLGGRAIEPVPSRALTGGVTEAAPELVTAWGGVPADLN